MKVLIWITVCLACFSCDRNIVCQSPPPTLNFQLKQGNDIYPIKTDSSSALKISCLDAKGSKTYIDDIRVEENMYTSMKLIYLSYNLKDPEFTLEFGQAAPVKFRLKTYMDNSRCNGWSRVSEIKQNNIVVPKSNARTYVLTL